MRDVLPAASVTPARGGSHAAARGADRAAERAGGYDDRRLEAGRPRASREYILYLRTYALSVCVWGVFAVSLRVCVVGLSSW